MRAIGTPPEADLLAVAGRDFANLTRPILVAAATAEQFDDFVWEEALICSEVRRFRRIEELRGCPEEKILLVLPGYYHDAKTAAAVEWWVDAEDRYTVHLDHPLPCLKEHQRHTRRALWLMSAAVLAVCVWVMFA